MERVIKIIQEWGFKKGAEGYYSKYMTPCSRVSFHFTEEIVEIKFSALFGELTGEVQELYETHRISMQRIGLIQTYGLKRILEDTIMKLVINVHKKCLFNGMKKNTILGEQKSVFNRYKG